MPGADARGSYFGWRPLAAEVVGDAEHKEVRAIVGGDIAAVELELGKVILVLNKRGDRIGHVVADTGQYVEAWSKRGFGPESTAGDIPDIEANP